MCGTVIHCAQRTVQYLHLSKMLSAIPNFSLYIFERAGFEPVGGNHLSGHCPHSHSKPAHRMFLGARISRRRNSY